MIGAVVVDVDDTLVLTETVCFDLENEVLVRLGRPPMAREVHVATWGQPLLDALAHRSPGVDVHRFEMIFRDLYAEHVSGGLVDVVAAENLAALDELASTGCQIMLLTSRTEVEVAHLLAPDHVLSSRLHAAYHAGNTRFRKPDFRVFDELLAASGLPPDECVYVGDSPSDAQAANGAGVRFIACLQSGLRTREEFDVHRVDAFVDAFPDVVAAVRRLDGR